MAKNKKSVTVEVSAVPAPTARTSADPWQTREDCNDIMRNAALREDKPRFKRAMNMLKSAVEGEGQKGSPRMKSRSGRRVSARNIGKR